MVIATLLAGKRLKLDSLDSAWRFQSEIAGAFSFSSAVDLVMRLEPAAVLVVMVSSLTPFLIYLPPLR